VTLGVFGTIFGNSLLDDGGASAATVGPSATPSVSGSFSLSYQVPRGTPVHGRVLAASAGNWNASAATNFWTPARLDAATPADQPKSTRSAAVPQTVTTTLAHASHYAGSSTIGVLFYADQSLTTHYCSASVIGSPKGNLILTAAHCQPGKWMAFVPMYQHGANVQPYGIWAVTKAFVDPHYTGSTGPGSDYDYALAVVAPRNGKQVEQVTGGNRVVTTPGYRQYVTAVGYPKITADRTDQAIRCTPSYPTTQLSGYRQMVLLCTGFYGGTSGGPWLLHFNGTSGYLVGLTGGEDAGGPNSWTSYSPIIDSRFFGLLQYAELH
jgi:hypothetical protein